MYIDDVCGDSVKKETSGWVVIEGSLCDVVSELKEHI